MPSKFMRTFAEIRSDLGGAKLALEAHSYNCIDSKTWEDFLTSSLHSIDRGTISDCDVLTIQFPTSDTVSGLWGPDGDWISARYVASKLSSILEIYNPRTLILIGRSGILSEGNGSTFAELLISLSMYRYEACWVRFNLASWGIPQDANRIAIVAIQASEFAGLRDMESPSLTLLSNIRGVNKGKFKLKKKQCLENILDERRPRIGAPAPKKSNPYGSFGISSCGHIRDFEGAFSNEFSVCPTLPNILGLEESDWSQGIRSARFVSRSGVRSIQLKKGDLAHSIGPAISAWPLFAFPKQIGLFSKAEEAFNWKTRFGDYDVGRLTPQRSLLLFGSEAKCLSANLSEVTPTVSTQYKLVAATVSPKVVDSLITALEKTLGWRNFGGQNEVY